MQQIQRQDLWKMLEQRQLRLEMQRKKQQKNMVVYYQWMRFIL